MRYAIILAIVATLGLLVAVTTPAGAVEIVASGNVEVVSTSCATLQCNTVADGGGLEVTWDGSTANSYVVGTRVRVKATDDVTLGTKGVANGIPVGTSPEMITFGSTNGLGLQPRPAADLDGGVQIYCKSTSGTPTVSLCPVYPGLGGR
jgi:hypothetical protein